MPPTVYIIIGCDTDPDRPSFIPDIPMDSLSWRGMLEGIPETKKRVREIRDSEGNPPIFTWCLRADCQIKHYYGSHNHVLKEHKTFFEGLEASGDEIAWHPHFWRFDEKQQEWYQEHADVDWQVNMLKDAHKSFTEVFPDCPQSVRMGWDYHNNQTFSALEQLGIKVDFSGIPGLQIKPKSTTSRGVNYYDWSLAPNRPYHGARVDYRREATANEPAFTLLEAPNFVSKSLLWSMIAGTVFSLKMKDLRPLLNSLVRPSFWITITGKQSYFVPLISQAVRAIKSGKDVMFVTYFHPDEIIVNKNKLYALSYMIDNLSVLVAMVKQFGGVTKYIRAKDVISYYNPGQT